jgi:hypothetical protein
VRDFWETFPANPFPGLQEKPLGSFEGYNLTVEPFREASMSRFLTLILIAILFTACAPVGSATVTTFTPILTPTATSTPIPTATASPAPTSTPSLPAPVSEWQQRVGTEFRFTQNPDGNFSIAGVPNLTIGPDGRGVLVYKDYTLTTTIDNVLNRGNGVFWVEGFKFENGAWALVNVGEPKDGENPADVLPHFSSDKTWMDYRKMAFNELHQDTSWQTILNLAGEQAIVAPKVWKLASGDLSGSMSDGTTTTVLGRMFKAIPSSAFAEDAYMDGSHAAFDIPTTGWGLVNLSDKDGSFYAVAVPYTFIQPDGSSLPASALIPTELFDPNTPLPIYFGTPMSMPDAIRDRARFAMPALLNPNSLWDGTNASQRLAKYIIAHDKVIFDKIGRKDMLGSLPLDLTNYFLTIFNLGASYWRG